MTLRARLIVALVVVAVAIVSAGFVIVAMQRHYLVDQLDRQLVTSRGAAPSLFRAQPPPADATVRFRERRLPSDLFDIYIAQVDTSGAVTNVFVPGVHRFGVPELRGKNLARLEGHGPLTITSTKSGESYRVSVRRAPNGFAGYIVVGLPLNRVDAATRRLVLVISIAAAIILGVLAIAWWWVVRLGLRPIRAVTDAADAIAHGDVDRRVEDLPARTEAERLGAAFNLMVDARQASDDRLRRFIADASHELRTPLTSIRGYAELYRRGAFADAGSLDDAMRRVGQEAARMTELVEDMLLLARLDEGRPMERTTLDLAPLLRDAVSDARAVQPERPIDCEVAGPLMTTGDENRLRQVFGALVTNALVHTDANAAVTVRARRDNGFCVVDVEDRGSGMPPELAARAFGRFVRGDASRGRHHGGSGLGLAIVESVVVAHGGDVTLHTEQSRGTTVRVNLPAATLAYAGEPRSQLGVGYNSL